jgi:hypothetical protein
MPRRHSGVLAGNRRRTSGVQPATMVPGWVCWFDASQITGQADGTQIEAWNDESVNNYRLFQGTAADQPYYYSSTPSKLVNGLPAVWFGPSYSMNNTMVFAQPVTVFCVAQSEDTANPEDVWQDRSGSPSLYRIPAHSAFQLNAGAGDQYAGVLDTKVRAIAVVLNGASSLFYLGSTNYTLGNPGTAAFSIGIQVGRSDVLSNNGPVCEIIIYNTALSVANILQNQAYLAAKWGAS